MGCNNLWSTGALPYSEDQSQDTLIFTRVVAFTRTSVYVRPLCFKQESKLQDGASVPFGETVSRSPSNGGRPYQSVDDTSTFVLETTSGRPVPRMGPCTAPVRPVHALHLHSRPVSLFQPPSFPQHHLSVVREEEKG